MTSFYSINQALADIRSGLSPNNAERRLRAAGRTVGRYERAVLRGAAKRRQYPCPLREHGDQGIAAHVVNIARTQAHGSYQRGVLCGDEAWSGAGLQGTARKWGPCYQRSRKALLSRINAALETTLGWSARVDRLGSATAKVGLVLTDAEGRDWRHL